MALKKPLQWVGYKMRVTIKSLNEAMRRFFVSEDGPTAVEYAVMLALIVIVCLSAIGLVGTKASSTFTYTADSLPS
jgi:pilus assembly protein Flp/PilA